jgi:hypothetical protein
MITERTLIRRQVAIYLRQGETPEATRNMMRGEADAATVGRIVYEECQKIGVEEKEPYEPSHVDTTGLVQWAAGHYADPRSAEIILAARRARR